MKRKTYTAVTEIEGRDPVTVIKYAHNSALDAAKSALRDAARGGYWHRESASKSATETVVHYRHDDGRAARITVTRPTD